MLYEGQNTIFDPTEQFNLIRLINNADEMSQKKHEEGERPLSLIVSK